MKFLIILTLVYLHLPLVVSAQYTPLLNNLPGGLGDPSADFNAYINALYVLSISIAALLAVIKIIIAGVKWMTTDIVTTKGEAKEDIRSALIGLLIVLSAVVILTIINPQLVNVDLDLRQIETRSFDNNPGGALSGTEYACTRTTGQASRSSDYSCATARNNCNDSTPGALAQVSDDGSRVICSTPSRSEVLQCEEGTRIRTGVTVPNCRKASAECIGGRGVPVQLNSESITCYYHQ